MTGRDPRVFTIAPGSPFLPTLAAALVGRRLVPGFPDPADPLSLSRATIFLPTRRAARALAAEIARCTGTDALLLPRIVPLGDVPEEGEWPEPDSQTGAFGADPTLPPALAETERRLVLTRLVLAWAKSVDRATLRLTEGEPLLVPASPGDALALAGDLARLMDALTTEGVVWAELAGLVEERFDRYFSITLTFLKIAAEIWPQVLAERGASDPVSRRNALLLAQARRLTTDAGGGPMIAAGSTGSMPATAALLRAIAYRPDGAVVLPGLDLDLDEPSWKVLTEAKADGSAFGHPQAILAHLIKTIGIARGQVATLGEPSAPARARNRVLSEALRPAATTDLWAKPGHRPDAASLEPAFARLALVEAADEREEALACALAMREALEDKDKTAALITPDRGLAERVSAELKRWGIEVDDSAGVPLSRTAPGRFARLVAEVAAGGAAPRDLVALLAHPLATFGWRREVAERAAAALEIGLLRGPAPPPGLAGLRQVLAGRRAEAASPFAARPVRRLAPWDWELAETLLGRLDMALQAFRAWQETGGGDLVALAAAHRAAVEAIAAPAGGEPGRLYAGTAGEALGDLFNDLAVAADCAVEGTLAHYPAFFAGLAGERPVRSEARGHRRAKIWGLLEARLLTVDRVVAGGLDEGIWPPPARTDAFLNRPMRAALGLTPPERRIGQTAHDFVQALGADDVVVTRALKREGAPTMPSRFLQRLKAVVRADTWTAAAARGRRYLAYAAALDRAAPQPPLRRPAPRPPLDLVPRSLSVTEIETLVRDPYAVYARHVLKLDPLDDLALPPGASDRGSIIHEALGTFAGKWPQELPADPLAELLALGRDAFAELAAYPDIAARWWPRFTRIAEAFVQWERARRPGIARVHAEISGRLAIPLATGDVFTLRARADRIEENRDGSLTIVDFKTGAPPGMAEVFVGFSPQLTLEAAMLVRGAFAEGGPRMASGVLPAVDLLYVQATGGAAPLVPKPVKAPKDDERSVEAIVDEHLRRLEALLNAYVAGERGFTARPFAKFAKAFNPYDHLARVGEWAGAGDEGEGA